MNRPITVRLPNDLQEFLQSISKKEHIPISDVVRESIRRYISIYQFRQLRRKTLPFAEAHGLLVDVDEDVFRELK
jgi:Arc/MetJ-type ribon-helix-helix transcriptional regulator